MNNTENPSTGSWERIQGGVRETERLIGQKKYNMAMIKARQTLEYMVKCQCDKEGIMESGLIDMIDALFDNDCISKTTCEHYHKIRTIGNKANHEDDNSAYNANQAHHLLSQEVYTFANDQKETRKRRSSLPPASRTADTSRGRHSSSGSGRTGSRRRTRTAAPSFDLSSLIKPLLLVAIVLVLLFIINMLRPDEKAEETTAPVTTEMTTESTAETETEPPTTAPVMYKTTDTVNVRSTPSTDKARIGLLGPDTEVEYVSDYDDKWCIIKYNGQDAYVVKEYLKPVS